MNLIGIGCCIGFVLLVIAREIASLWLASRRSGWRRLADRYPGPPGRPGGAVECRVRVGDRWCPSCVTVVVTGAGLGLSFGPLLARPFHRPVLVPWDDLTFVRDDWDGDELPLRVGDVAFLRLTGAAVPLAAGHLNRQRRGAHRRD